MTRAELLELQKRASAARSSCSALSSMISPLQSETASGHLATIGDFLRNVESSLQAAGSVEADANEAAPPTG